MKTRPYMTAIMLAAFLFVVVFGGLAACGGEPANVDPQAVLSAASAKMKEIVGFHFVYEVHKPASIQPGKGLEIVRITGDLSTDGNMQAKIDVLSGGVPLALDFVAVGDTHYLRDPLSQKWQTIPAAESPVGTLNLSRGTIRILDQITSTKYEGTDKKGGAKTYHISGMVAAADVEAIAGSTNTDQPFPTEVWVGVNDSLLYEVDIFGAATPNETEDYWRSIILSNLDVPVDIVAPQ